MAAIFMDLEFCEVDEKNRQQRKICKFEVIEIGAVKLNDENQIADRFDILVKPQYGSISSFISELTNITNEKVAQAIPFAEAMDVFLKWIGEEDIEVYSWSNTDWIQLQRESRQKKYVNSRLDRLYENWIDFQMVFGQILGIEQKISLANALNGIGIAFEGQEHSAADDAENTAILFVLTQNREEFKKQASAILDVLRPSPALSVCIGSLFTSEMRQTLVSR